MDEVAGQLELEGADELLTLARRARGTGSTWAPLKVYRAVSLGVDQENRWAVRATSLDAYSRRVL